MANRPGPAGGGAAPPPPMSPPGGATLQFPNGISLGNPNAPPLGNDLPPDVVARGGRDAVAAAAPGGHTCRAQGSTGRGHRAPRRTVVRHERTARHGHPIPLIQHLFGSGGARTFGRYGYRHPMAAVCIRQLRTSTSTGMVSTTSFKISCPIRQRAQTTNRTGAHQIGPPGMNHRRCAPLSRPLWHRRGPCKVQPMKPAKFAKPAPRWGSRLALPTKTHTRNNGPRRPAISAAHIPTAGLRA